MIPNLPLSDHRCSCGRLLFKALIRTAWVQVKCRRCGELVHFSPGYARSASSATKILSESTLVLRDHVTDELLRTHTDWVRVDGLWRITQVSEGFCALLSLDQEDLIETKIFELFTPECVQLTSPVLIAATSDRAPFVLEYVLFTACPETIFRMHGVSLESGEGRTLVFEAC